MRSPGRLASAGPTLFAALGVALGTMLGVALQPAATRPAAGGTRLEQRAWLIMGTFLEISLYADSSQALPAFDAAYRAAARVDSLMSLYRPESEISLINREASKRPIPLSRETAAVVAAALRYTALSGGAFDITVKPMMDAWGFYRKVGHIPSGAERDSLVRLSGAGRLHLEAGNNSIRLEPGTAIDLGGIAKGYAVDLMAGELRAAGIVNALVNLGGNLRALGAPPGSPEGWAVGVRDPADPDSVLCLVFLRDRSLASSGDYETYVEIGGRRYGHIIDPRTAAPVEGVLGTAVVASDAMTADILSTTVFVLGRDAGLRLARNLAGVEALCVTGDGAGRPRYTATGFFGSADLEEALPGGGTAR